MNADKLKLLEEFIEKQPKFRVEGHTDGLSLEEFIYAFQQGYLRNANNSYIETGKNMKVKYDAMRSLVDTIIACRSHYNVTVEEVLEVFRDAYKKGTLVGHYCNDIGRLILRPKSEDWGNHIDADSHVDKNLPFVTYGDLFFDA